MVTVGRFSEVQERQISRNGHYPLPLPLPPLHRTSRFRIFFFCADTSSRRCSKMIHQRPFPTKKNDLELLSQGNRWGGGKRSHSHFCLQSRRPENGLGVPHSTKPTNNQPHTTLTPTSRSVESRRPSFHRLLASYPPFQKRTNLTNLPVPVPLPVLSCYGLNFSCLTEWNENTGSRKEKSESKSLEKSGLSVNHLSFKAPNEGAHRGGQGRRNVPF